MSYVDPTGEILFLAPVLLGIGINVALDLFIQTQIEQKSLQCVNIVSTITSGALGVIPGTSLIKPFKAYKAAKKREKAIRRIIPRFRSPTAHHAIDRGLLAGNLSLASTSANFEFTKFLPELTFKDKCEC